MIIPPYLQATDLTHRMLERPIIPFFVFPGDYRVVDGDTIKILAAAPRGEKRQEAFRIRFASVDAPEKPWASSGDRILESLGFNPNPDHSFSRITDALKSMVEGRALLIEPFNDPKKKATRDGYGRLLAHVTVSGEPGRLFVPYGAYSVEHVMLQKGLVRQMKDNPVPSLRTELVERLQEFIEEYRDPQVLLEAGERPSY